MGDIGPTRPMGDIGPTQPMGDIGPTSAPLGDGAAQTVVCDVTINIRVIIPSGASVQVRTSGVQGDIAPTGEPARPVIDPAGELDAAARQSRSAARGYVGAKSARAGRSGG